MSVIRAFNRTDDEKAAEIGMFTELSNKETRLARTYAIGLPSILIIFNMSTVVILWLGGYQIDSGVLQIGDYYGHHRVRHPHFDEPHYGCIRASRRAGSHYLLSTY